MGDPNLTLLKQRQAMDRTTMAIQDLFLRFDKLETTINLMVEKMSVLTEKLDNSTKRQTRKKVDLEE